jgi:hypothetical protein
MRKTAIVAAALGLLPLWGAGRARGGASAVGTSGAQFLKIAPGARAAGMGQAFAGVAEGVETIYYNPAGLGDLMRVEVTGMHDSYFQDIDYEFAALAVPMLSWVDTKKDKNAYGVLGAAVYDLSVRNIEQRSLTETDQPLGTFGSTDLAYAVGYAYALPDTGLSLGATAKVIDQNIDNVSASAFALDLGGLYQRGGLRLGAGLRNFGTQSKFTSAADPMPLTIFGGASYRITDAWLTSIEMDLPRDNGAIVGLGAEYRKRFADKLTGAARIGYNSSNSDAGGWAGTSFGLGVGYGNLSFDFAFVPFGDLGNTFRYSLTAKF